MNDLTIFDSKNFLSENERQEVKKSVFKLKDHWRNMITYPCQDGKEDFFKTYQFRQLINQLKYNFLTNTQNIGAETAEKVWKFLHQNYSFVDIDLKISVSTFMNMLEIIKNSQNVDDHLLKNLYLEVSKKDRCQNNLGDAIYLLNQTGREKIDWEVQKILKKEFRWIHDKTIRTISSIFNKEVELDSSLPCPGFHIFNSDTSTICDYNYHQDITILEYYPKVNIKKIYSFISLIDSSIEEIPHLEYKSTFDCFKKNYEYGTLHFWPGVITHKIGSFKIEKNQYRITYQGHIYFDETNNIYKLYF